jgi:hypothetical protein
MAKSGFVDWEKTAVFGVLPCSSVFSAYCFFSRPQRLRPLTVPYEGVQLMKQQLLLSVIVLLLVGIAFARQPPAGAPPIKSPEIKADGSVIFRLVAP